MTLKKEFKNIKKKIKKLKKLKQTKAKLIIWTLSAIFCLIRELIIKTDFSELKFLFSILSPQFSRNSCKLRRKLHNAKI